MGYDMYFDTCDVDCTDDVHYFRLNIRGMGHAVAIMEPLDMVFAAANAPTKQDWRDLPPMADEDDGGPEYDDAVERLVGRLAGEERPGIPVHKVYSSNDGWHVKPIECLGALHQYETAKSADPDRVNAIVGDTPWWDEWLDFIARAARDGNGFRVQ